MKPSAYDKYFKSLVLTTLLITAFVVITVLVHHIIFQSLVGVILEVFIFVISAYTLVTNLVNARHLGRLETGAKTEDYLSTEEVYICELSKRIYVKGLPRYLCILSSKDIGQALYILPNDPPAHPFCVTGKTIPWFYLVDKENSKTVPT